MRLPFFVARLRFRSHVRVDSMRVLPSCFRLVRLPVCGCYVCYCICVRLCLSQGCLSYYTCVYMSCLFRFRDFVCLCVRVCCLRLRLYAFAFVCCKFAFQSLRVVCVHVFGLFVCDCLFVPL